MIEVKLELFSSIVKKFYYQSPIVVNVEQGPRPTDKLTKDQSNYWRTMLFEKGNWRYFIFSSYCRCHLQLL